MGADGAYGAVPEESKGSHISRFLSNPFMIRVPFFLIFSFNKGNLNQKGQKGTTQEPRY